MGLIDRLLGLVFGGGRNAVTQTVEVFRENAEKGAQREVDLQTATLAQFAEEFRRAQRTPFDRLMDAVNRIPRPAMAIGTLALFVAAMVDPVWFAARMQGIALVPEPLWWLLGAIVSFYFGARHQSKGQEFQRELARSLASVQGVMGNVRAIEALAPADRAENVAPDGPQQAAPADAAPVSPSSGTADPNPALTDWRKAA